LRRALVMKGRALSRGGGVSPGYKRAYGGTDVSTLHRGKDKCRRAGDCSASHSRIVTLKRCFPRAAFNADGSIPWASKPIRPPGEGCCQGAYPNVSGGWKPYFYRAFSRLSTSLWMRREFIATRIKFKHSMAHQIAAPRGATKRA
jgi:hypothetical protein